MDVVTLEKNDAIYEIYSNIRVYYVHVIPIDNWIFLPKPTPTNHSHLKSIMNRMAKEPGLHTRWIEVPKHHSATALISLNAVSDSK